MKNNKIYISEKELNEVKSEFDHSLSPLEKLNNKISNDNVGENFNLDKTKKIYLIYKLHSYGQGSEEILCGYTDNKIIADNYNKKSSSYIIKETSYIKS